MQVPYSAVTRKAVGERAVLQHKVIAPGTAAYLEHRAAGGFRTMVVDVEDIFDEYGLEAPETWEEFLEVCETLKANGIAIPFPQREVRILPDQA